MHAHTNGQNKVHQALIGPQEERMDPATAFLYKPRTITVGALGEALLQWSLVMDQRDDTH